MRLPAKGVADFSLPHFENFQTSMALALVLVPVLAIVVLNLFLSYIELRSALHRLQAFVVVYALIQLNEQFPGSEQ